MTTEQTISWIFMSTAYASKNDFADLQSISSMADGINRAVPTQEELENSMIWLKEKGLIVQHGDKYALTPKGKSDYKEASKKTTVVFKIWDNLDMILRKYDHT